MDIYLRVDATPGTLLELAHWLAQDHQLPPESRDPRLTPGAEAHMGATLDLLQLVIGNAIALSALLVSVDRWRRSRPDRPTVRVVARQPDGATVTVESDDPEALATLVREWDGRSG
ncbi:effector-associated constant component EACC1 [Pilimelia columellifera]|uniref:Uncharacterized protein n=1 Tax=Pilimelia columellifera subsp. columellifera TaxID=706583 RepID=A0ABN3N3A8_9ACTN